MLQSVPFPIKESWTHEFCCLPFTDQRKSPSSSQMEKLTKAGLGKTKIVFPDKHAKHPEVCQMLEETFPQLKEVGGFTLYRAKSGGQTRDLYQLTCSWFNIKDIKKDVPGSACIYIKPVQKDLDLTRKPMVFNYIICDRFWQIALVAICLFNVTCYKRHMLFLYGPGFKLMLICKNEDLM